MKKIKVFSGFNGMGCIGLALKKLGIPFELYSSEIDKYANQVNSALFPNTINLGDITKIDLDSLPVFDLVVGGSPCQGFSFAGKQLNFDDERSKLFFDFVRILEHSKKVNPQVKFLLENVKMKKEYEAVISRFMGIDPIEINSSLLSAQSRKRLYWTNIGTTKRNLFWIEEPGIKQPKDKGILLKDILESEVDERYYINTNWAKFVTNPERLKKKYTQIDGNKAITQTARQYASWCGDFIIQNGHGFNKGGEFKEKSPTLTSNSWEHNNHVIQMNPSKESGGKQPYQQNRVYSTEGKSPCLDTDSRSKNIQLRGKSKCVRSSGRLSNDRHEWDAVDNLGIRRLTPRECGRLQTVPEWAIDIMLNCGVSDSQLYKMVGNGWTVDVIAYILKHLTK